MTQVLAIMTQVLAKLCMQHGISLRRAVLKQSLRLPSASELAACTAHAEGSSLPPTLSAMQDAKMYCREILDILKTLKRTRDMSVNEARLIIAIEDPRARERRSVGIEVRRAAWSTRRAV